MEFIAIIIVIIVVIVLIARAGSRTGLEQVGNRLSDLTNEIRDLRKQVEKLSKQNYSTTTPGQIEATAPEPVKIAREENKPATPVAPVQEPVKSELAQEKKIPVFEVPSPKPMVIEEPTKEGWFTVWLRDNPDIEKFIGENLINKIGIGVLVLGIAFFVKYAIDKEWINEPGRISIGLLCGSLLILIAHRMRNSYRSFSSVLVGGGLTVFYFTIAFAFHQYHLISQVAAFGIMVLITAFAVLLSILYNRIELAILATIGGFITPFLVSTGNNNYIALFAYLGILNSGLIVLAYFKKWVPINFIAFIFTILIYGGWLVNLVYANSEIPYSNAFLFATMFYFLFIVMQLSNHIKSLQKFNRYDFILLLAINASYYGAGMFILKHLNHGQWQGLFTACLGILNLTLAWIFYKQQKFDRNFVYLLIGLTLTFVSLAAPVQLEGNHITLFWAAEAVLLFWFYQQSSIRLVKITSVAILLLSLVSLLQDWVVFYASDTEILPVIINKGCITGIAVSVAFIIYYRLLYKEANTFFLSSFPVQWMKNILVSLIILLLLFTGILEIHHQFNSRYPGTNLHFVFLQLFVLAYSAGIVAALSKLKINVGANIRLAVPLLLFVLYVFNITNIYQVEQYVLNSGNHQLFFSAHWVSVIFLVLLIAGTIKYFKNNYAAFRSIQNGFSVITSVALIIVVSVEIRNIYVWLTYSGINSLAYAQNLYSKAGLSMVWGLSSFVLIWLGMKYKFKTLRIVALLLFGGTLVKLFSFDIRNIPPGGKIVAFILLGIVLLIVSFMYQRLKKILLDDAMEKK